MSNAQFLEKTPVVYNGGGWNQTSEEFLPSPHKVIKLTGC